MSAWGSKERVDVMGKRDELGLALSALLALGCGGNAVDLGASNGSRWSDAAASPSDATKPQTIYEGAQPIMGFALDGATLYALVDGKDAFELITCPLTHCRSERTTLFSRSKADGQVPQPTALVLAGGMLYWVDSREQRTVVACPTTGCSEPLLVGTNWDHGLAADDEGAYWLDFERELVRGEPGVEAPTLVRDLSDEAWLLSNLVTHGDDVYFVASDIDTFSIRRVPKDGSRPAELVATDQVISGFSLAGDKLYYLSRILTGRVATCPLEGCSAEVSTLAANQRWPGAIKVAGNELFWLNSTQWDYDTSQGKLVSCQLPNCATPQTRSGEFSFAFSVDQDQSFAVNQDAIVWLERAHGLGTRLRRLAR